MPHLSNDLNNTFYKIRIADIFVGFVECNPFVESLTSVLRS